MPEEGGAASDGRFGTELRLRLVLVPRLHTVAFPLDFHNLCMMDQTVGHSGSQRDVLIEDLPPVFERQV